MSKRTLTRSLCRKRLKPNQQILISTWNVCGFRALLRKSCLDPLLHQQNPDIICLNQTMLQQKNIADLSLPPQYHHYFTCSTAKKGYSGVAIFTKQEPLKVQPALLQHNAQGRSLLAEYPRFYLLATYVPNSGPGCWRLNYRTLQWDPDVRSLLKTLQSQKPVIWCGDLNVVHQDIDIYDIRNKQTWACCTPEQRSSFSQTLADCQLVDSFRALNPQIRDWSYFSRRNKNAKQKGQGWRLDYILTSQELQSNIAEAYIRNDIIGSDHHPCLMKLRFQERLQMEGPPRETLVHYENPVEISLDFVHPKKRVLGPSGRKKVALPPIESKPSIEEYLNSILPPREWFQDNARFIQYISQQESVRQDVIKLKEDLDLKLMERQARDQGICPVRQELYSQCFDEIIRQVTIKCPERGLLLMRVRNEIKMTIAAYQTLYQSSVTFGTRKQLQAEEGKSQMQEKRDELQKQKIRLENKKAELLNKKEALIKKYEEKRAADEAKRKSQLDFLEYQGKHLDSFLKGIENKG